MIVSWNWLKEYVALEESVETITDRLTMTGLNLEGVEEHIPTGDTAVDLEVTSNRPDCLGHIGVAREISVLFDTPLNTPGPQPPSNSEKTASVTSVEIECEDHCPQYIARVIRGVKVGPSPAWMQDRLAAVGVAAVNNIVDITNYVLLECGQPLHAFDLDKLKEQHIVVRKAKANETLTAIDHKEYKLDPEMCVIADAERPVAIAGVMGGAETEISESTVNLLIETANFAPLSIRTTARKLSLFSDSSYRFERGVDAVNLDWASRRCCELILQIAGGELLEEPVVAGTPAEATTTTVPLRYAQLKRLLGIEIPADRAAQILVSLGMEQTGDNNGTGQFIPPTWRRDLTREVDLIEEVARIYGYEHIPQNAPVPLVSTKKSLRERVSERIRQTLMAAGFYEGITISFISDKLAKLFTPRGDERVLAVDHSSRQEENHLRQSLIPSLLRVRRENERQGNFNAQLFELAKVYLKANPGEAETEVEPMMISMVSGRNFRELKGVIESLARSVNPQSVVTMKPASVPQFATGRGGEVLLNGKPWGWLGELDRSVTDQLDLRDAVTVAELAYHTLEDSAELIGQFTMMPQYPAMNRDLNFVVDEATTWDQLAETVTETAGPLMESLSFSGQYRGKQIPADKKSYVLTVTYRSAERTLTSEEVDESQQKIVTACESKLNAQLRG